MATQPPSRGSKKASLDALTRMVNASDLDEATKQSYLASKSGEDVKAPAKPAPSDEATSSATALDESSADTDDETTAGAMPDFTKADEGAEPKADEGAEPKADEDTWKGAGGYSYKMLPDGSIEATVKGKTTLVTQDGPFAAAHAAIMAEKEGGKAPSSPASSSPTGGPPAKEDRSSRRERIASQAMDEGTAAFMERNLKRISEDPKATQRGEGEEPTSPTPTEPEPSRNPVAQAARAVAGDSLEGTKALGTIASLFEPNVLGYGVTDAARDVGLTDAVRQTVEAQTGWDPSNLFE